MEKEERKKRNEVQTKSKEKFEPLEMKVVEVKVEKGYATSGTKESTAVTVRNWNTGTW